MRMAANSPPQLALPITDDDDDEDGLTLGLLIDNQASPLPSCLKETFLDQTKARRFYKSSIPL